ncbi:MAG: uncharacterized protein V7606_4621 [Burkholderiales bacterium]
MQATRTPLDDGRLHFQHGPIDLIIGADGEPDAVSRAGERMWQRFCDVLPELVGELALLRRPVRDPMAFHGRVSQRMFEACWPHRAEFITPMAAVAGSVADELIGFFREESGVARAYINNGGDIALHLNRGQSYRIGLFANLAKFGAAALELDGEFEIAAALPVRGIATSGWRGRSFSLGIADSVTVFAATAAAADAAATMIANRVNCDHPSIERAPANSLKDDTDLGELPVTVDVGVLPFDMVQAALEQGAWQANCLLRSNIIFGAVMTLQGQARALGLQEMNRQAVEAGGM